MSVINVDAAFDVDSGSTATGAIIRDDHGTSLAAANKILNYVVDAPTVEAYAFREDLALAQQLSKFHSPN